MAVKRRKRKVLAQPRNDVGLWAKLLQDADEVVRADAVRLRSEVPTATRSAADIANDVAFLVAYDGTPVGGAVWLYARRLAREAGHKDLGLIECPED